MAGDGLAADAIEAVRWFRLAAVRGEAGSMYLLGECLLSGEGTKQNRDAALGWFAAAGDLGHRGARASLLSAYIARKDSIARRQTEDAAAEPAARSATDANVEWWESRYARAAGRKGSEWVFT